MSLRTEVPSPKPAHRRAHRRVERAPAGVLVCPTDYRRQTHVVAGQRAWNSSPAPVVCFFGCKSAPFWAAFQSLVEEHETAIPANDFARFRVCDRLTGFAYITY